MDTGVTTAAVPLLSPAAVQDLLTECLLAPDESEDGAPFVECPSADFRFDAGRLAVYREPIRELLAGLSPAFRTGWSLINASLDRDGRRWTTSRRDIEGLAALAIGAGLAHWSFPREAWRILYRGFPYLTIDKPAAGENGGSHV